jgi:hypothetical protein
MSSRGLPGTFFPEFLPQSGVEKWWKVGDFPARQKGLPGTKKGTSRHEKGDFPARFSKPKYRYQDVQEGQEIIRIRSL